MPNGSKSAILTISLLAATAHGAIWYVHPDSALNSIQAGLDSCAAGDTILVAAATYHENIEWPNIQGIKLLSEHGSSVTMIDGSDTARVVRFSHPVDTMTVIEGFTIQNGNALQYSGGGIRCDSFASPAIRNNRITANHAHDGAGIACIGSDAVIAGNMINNNSAGGSGGGILCAYGGSATIRDNIIDDNVVSSMYTTCGGGISCVEASPRILRSTITNNGGLYTQGGGISIWRSNVLVEHSIVAGNICYLIGAGIYCVECIVLMKHCTVNENSTYAGSGGGIHAMDANLTIDSSTISSNGIDGIWCTGDSAITIRYCNITGNEGYAVYNHLSTSDTVDARYNWWGHATGPYDPIANPGGLGDTVGGNVKFNPWLVQPGIESVTDPAPVTCFVRAFPNPFSTLTKINFSVEYGPERMEINVYDATGRLVRSFNPPSSIQALESFVLWDGTDHRGNRLPGGAYILMAKGAKTGTKLLLVR